MSPPGPVANSGAVFHGNHMMVGMALGFLFLSGAGPCATVRVLPAVVARQNMQTRHSCGQRPPQEAGHAAHVFSLPVLLQGVRCDHLTMTFQPRCAWMGVGPRYTASMP